MWDALINYGNQHPRWFEPLSRYAPEPDLLAVYREQAPAAWQLTRRGLWFIAHPPMESLPRQGWKLHVSSAPASATEVLRRASAVLFEREVSFKFLLDVPSLSRSSAKRWPRGSSGKFITVYPHDDEEFIVTAKELARALAGTEGPFILSDRRVPETANLFYRYGGFAAIKRLQPDGSTMLMVDRPDGEAQPDVRNPFFSKPAWAVDPFGDPDLSTGVPELNDGRYAMNRALIYTNAGGVYLALDKHTGNEVVIKEARPHILVGRLERDAQQMLAKEFEILQLLADTGHVAKPVELFSQWEHTFLVEEFIDGDQMSSRSIPRNPLVNLQFDATDLIEYYTEQRQQWLGLLDAITAAHARGVVLSDLSFTNVLIDRHDGRVVLIDFEAAVRLGVDEPVGLYTPGVSAPNSGSTSDRAMDYRAFGALMLGSVFLVNLLVGYHPEALQPALTALTTDLSLPPELPAIIESLMRPDNPEPPDPTELRARLAALDFSGHPGWTSPVPISLPATEQDRLSDQELDRLLTGTAGQLRATADPTRTDRLFPTYLAAYETNPYSVEYGAAGILHTLHELDGRVDKRLTGWLLAGSWSNPDSCPPGLYTGTAGVAWVLEELGYRTLAERTLAGALRHPLAHHEPGLRLGTAGLGMAALRLHQRGTGSALDWARECGRRLADTAIIDDRGAHWAPGTGPVRSVEPSQPIGYANGASGISLFLLYLGQATGEHEWSRLGRQALAHDLSWAWHSPGGFVGFPAVTHKPGTEPTVVRSYWDEGTAGVATTLVRYRAIADDDELRAMWERMRPDLCRKYAVLPQLFHGLAGIGMALLDAAELLGDVAAGWQAHRLARGITLYAVPREDGIAWPSEQCYRESADLATGAAGVAMFLHRLRQPATGGSSNRNFVVDELLFPNGRR